MQKAEFRCFWDQCGAASVQIYVEFVFSCTFTEVAAAFVCRRKGVSAGSLSEQSACACICPESWLAHLEYGIHSPEYAMAQNLALRQRVATERTVRNIHILKPRHVAAPLCIHEDRYSTILGVFVVRCLRCRRVTHRHAACGAGGFGSFLEGLTMYAHSRCIYICIYIYMYIYIYQCIRLHTCIYIYIYHVL